MNTDQKREFKEYVKMNSRQMKVSPFLKTGENRGVDAKIGNYREVQELLSLMTRRPNINNDNVNEAVEIFKEVTGRVLEVQVPPSDGGAGKKLQTLQNASSVVKMEYLGVDVRLDNDQLKHQHPSVPIGTRMKGGGSRFKHTCDASWHKLNTMIYMATWASQIGGMVEGDQKYHGQSGPVNSIHYEGYCLMAGGNKYVLFHCYPERHSPLMW